MYNRLIESLVTSPKWYKFFGFTIVRNVLSATEVRELRDEINLVFNKYSNKSRVLPPHQFLSSKLIANAVLNPKITSRLKEIFGSDFYHIADYHVLRNNYGGWHIDSGSEAMAPYLFKKTYGFAKCGLFLQKAASAQGGGIDIPWFSHKFMFNGFPTPIRYFIQKFYQIIKVFLSHTVKLNPGDFIAFDSRLEHRSTPPTSAEYVNAEQFWPFPHEVSKYTVYFDACNRNSVESFVNNALRRAFIDEFLAEDFPKDFVVFADILSREFPNDYPMEFAEQIKAAGVSIHSFDETKRRKLKAHYENLLEFTSEAKSKTTSAKV